MSICQQSHPPLCVPLGCMTIGGDMSTVKKVLLIQLPILALSGVTLLNRLDNPAFNMQSPLTGTYNRKIMMWTLNLESATHWMWTHECKSISCLIYLSVNVSDYYVIMLVGIPSEIFCCMVVFCFMVVRGTAVTFLISFFMTVV